MPENKCSDCGLESNDLILIEGKHICEDCKDSFIQSIKEGVESPPEWQVVHLKEMKKSGSIIIGLLIGFSLHIVLAIVLFFAVVSSIHSSGGEIFGYAFMSFGLVQLIYMLPLIALFHYKQKKRTIIGLVICLVVAVIINIGCAGLVFIPLL
jgi:heme/copper-type cytochrome/quinol oxidase subunit 4